MPNQSKPGPWPDDGLVAEAAYLVARGVRPMALVYDGMADGPTMLELASRLEAIGDPGAIPMVVDHGDGRTGAGYAVAGWVIDLYEWVTSVDGRDPRPPTRLWLCGDQSAPGWARRAPVSPSHPA